MTKKVPKVVSEYMRRMGKKGGPKGGKARTSAMTPEQRTALARKAARARWGGRS